MLGKADETGLQLTDEKKLFEKIRPEDSGIDFVNKLEETLSSNYYQYMYQYIGAGVATEDFDNDGLIDIFFVSNSNQSILYKNEGNFKFSDISDHAGIPNLKGFSTGITTIDINSDGYHDIYISRGGKSNSNGEFANLLYINNQDLTFTESAAKYGIAGDERSIQAVFFDYDKDEDLDLYVSNAPDIKSKSKEIIDLEQVKNDPKTLALKGYDRLYRNNGKGRFEDVSLEAGILLDIGFGLNPQVGDINEDGWLDIYVCNDFRIPDFLYLNNQDGTFREARNEFLNHMSFNSMGGDMADINNDGLFDIVTLDMNPEDYVRSKTTMGMTSPKRFQDMIDNDYHYQYMHNMLQLNNGLGKYSEIGNMAGLANTDWSWSVLLADFDMDGYNDSFITNGVYRDVIDKDKNKEILTALRRNGRRPTAQDFLDFTKMLPQQKLQNYFFKNNSDLTFSDVSDVWVDSMATFSNGAAYADLDNDGDLDIVVNNINEEATILRNRANDNLENAYLNIELSYTNENIVGVGAIVHLNFKDGKSQVRQLMKTKGYLSSVSRRLYFGFKNSDSLDNITVTWPDNTFQVINSISPNNLMTIRYKEGKKKQNISSEKTQKLFNPVPFPYFHKEKIYDDFAKQVLLPHKLSQTGPASAVADLNGDGYDDMFIGGSAGFAGRILLGGSGDNFSELINGEIADDYMFEDVSAEFIDIDSDADLDLYVASGSYEFGINDTLLQDRLYLNDGNGLFSRNEDLLPEMRSAGSIIRASDFDNDGDIDLFVGSRVIPGQYPVAPRNSLLINQNGKYHLETKEISPVLEYIGMVTAASWGDINDDGTLDLIVTGEWMGIEVFENLNGKLVRSDKYPKLSKAVGWWNSLQVIDIDDDGDLDVVAGNLGLNSKHHASYEKPFHIYANDFDNNGTQDVFLAKYYKNKQVPVRGKTCATQQIPSLAGKVTSYNDFASRDIEGLLGEGIQKALHYQVTEFRSGIFFNRSGKFDFEPFPNEAQLSPINGILFEDIDGDDLKDFTLVGNNYHNEIETTRADAGIGVFLKGLGLGKFDYISNYNTGFYSNSDARNIFLINRKSDRKSVIVVNNNDEHHYFQIQNKKKLAQ